MSDVTDLIEALREHATEAWENRGHYGTNTMGASEEQWVFNRVADWIEQVYVKELVPAQTKLHSDEIITVDVHNLGSLAVIQDAWHVHDFKTGLCFKRRLGVPCTEVKR
jgi:hypothetical protein